MNRSTNAPDRRLRTWQIVTLATLFVGYAGYYVCRSNLSVASQSLIREFADVGFTKKTTGLISSVGVLVYAGGKLANGPLADMFGGRPVFLLGMVGSVLCTLAFGVGNTVAVFVVAFSLNRFSQSVGWGSLLHIVARWIPRAWLGTIMGVLTMSYLFGDTLARVYLGLFQRAGFEWRGVFFVSAATLAAIWGIAVLTLRGSPRDVGLDEPDSAGELPQDQRAERLADILVPLVANPMFWIVCVMSVGLTLIRETFNFWSPTYLNEVGGLDEGSASMVSGSFPLVGALAALGGGWLSDRSGGRHGRIVAPALVGVVAAMAGLALLPRGQGPWPATILICAVFFFMMAPYTFLSGVMALELGGKRGSSTACGLIDGTGYLGAALSVYVVGSLAEDYGWAAAIWTLAGVAAATMLAGLIYWSRQERSRRAETIDG